MATALENPFGIVLRWDTRGDLLSLGIVDWEGLRALSDGHRKLLFGWGPATEQRFQDKLAAQGT